MWLSSSLPSARTFSPSPENRDRREPGRRVTVGEPISYEEAQAFAEEAPEELTVAYSIFGTSKRR